MTHKAFLCGIVVIFFNVKHYRYITPHNLLIKQKGLSQVNALKMFPTTLISNYITFMTQLIHGKWNGGTIYHKQSQIKLNYCLLS